MRRFASLLFIAAFAFALAFTFAACDDLVSDSDDPSGEVIPEVDVTWDGASDTYTEVYGSANTYESELSVSVDRGEVGAIAVANETTGFEQTFEGGSSDMSVVIEDSLRSGELGLSAGESVSTDYEIEIELSGRAEGFDERATERVEIVRPEYHDLTIDAKTLLGREDNPGAEVYFAWRDIDTTFVADGSGQIVAEVPGGESELGLYGKEGERAETALDRLKVTRDFYPDEKIFTWYDMQGNPLDHAWHVNAPVWGEDLSEEEQLELSHAQLNVQDDVSTQMETLRRIEDYHRVRNINSSDGKWVGFNPYEEMRHILYEGNPACGHMEGVPAERLYGATPDSLFNYYSGEPCDDDGERIPGTVVGERQIKGFENYEEAVQEAVALHDETPWSQKFEVLSHDELLEEFPDIEWGDRRISSGFASNVAVYQAHGGLSGREWNVPDDTQDPEVLETAHVVGNYSILGTWFSLEGHFPGAWTEDMSGRNCTIRYDEGFEVPSETMNRCGWDDIQDVFPVLDSDKYEGEFDPVMYHKDDWQKGGRGFGNSYAIMSVISPTIEQKLMNGERGYNMDTFYHGDENMVDESLRR